MNNQITEININYSESNRKYDEEMRKIKSKTPRK